MRRFKNENPPVRLGQPYDQGMKVELAAAASGSGLQVLRSVNRNLLARANDRPVEGEIRLRRRLGRGERLFSRGSKKDVHTDWTR